MLVCGPTPNAGSFEYEIVTLQFGGMIESFIICTRHKIQGASFYRTLSTAVVTEYPGGCMLSTRWSCCAPGHDNRDTHTERKPIWNRKKLVLASLCPSVLLNGFLWNLIFRFFRKPVEKIQVSLKSDNNNGYFTWRRFHIYDNMSLNSS